MEVNNQVNFHEAKFRDQNGLLQITRVPVVQELSRLRLQEFPERFISLGPDDQSAPSHELSDALNFQATDMSKLVNGFEPEGRAQELANLATVLKEWGMFLVKNHGIDLSVLRDLQEAVKGFFELPFEEKKATVGSYLSVDNMGYGRNFVKSEHQALDWIDRLTMKVAPKHATQGLDVWPRRPSNFRQVIEEYAEGARRICNELLQAIAEALSLDRHVFYHYFDPEKSEMNVRVNCYPPCPRPDLAVGITPHSDASALTVLIQFGSSGGLQVFKHKKWLAVPWPCDTLLVSLGDLLEIMSNGRLQSPWHRAITQRNVERFSVALFYNPPSEAEIEPVRDGESSSQTAYKKVSVGEYLRNYYKISPTKTKRAIMFAKSQ